MTGHQPLQKGTNSYFYPAFGLSFVLTDAIEALKNNPILSFAKITASNSTVYNDLSAYRINETYSKHSSISRMAMLTVLS